MSELIARLNPSTIRFDTGRGGIPDLTAQDIAAALAMVHNKTGAGMLQYLHCWTEREQFRFEVEIFRMMREQCIRRADELVNSQLRYYLTAGRKGTLENLSRVVAEQGKQWPSYTPESAGMYARLVMAVLSEIAGGATCKTCNGHGKLPSTEGTKECQECGGTGRAGDSQRVRAARMRLSQRGYAQSWQEPYHWLFSELMGAMNEANSQFRQALGRRVAA